MLQQKRLKTIKNNPVLGQTPATDLAGTPSTKNQQPVLEKHFSVGYSSNWFLHIH